MGQRHQIFIGLVNPVKNSRHVTDVMKKHCGKRKIAILPYHNQNLYGRSALQTCLNVLIHSSQYDVATKLGEGKFFGYKTPFSIHGHSWTFSQFDKLTQSVGFIMDYMQKHTEFNEAGLSGSWYIGEEDYGIQHDFTGGDNNDGITIIDTINNKYCFMNIHKWENREDGERCNSASDLPYLTPVSAHDYVTAYYGETVETLNQYYVDKAVAKGKTAEWVAAKHIQENAKLVKQFKNFELLTVKEVITMFPQMKQRMLEANKNMI